ncbi:MAG: DNA-binding protein [Deltaproteobacteria bacterium]|nr:DNA-binding protein [Deltaproteobacteria bacterium]MBI3016775.1 DNA-binding protein [Deltaproteobacteria bacterium]
MEIKEIKKSVYAIRLVREEELISSLTRVAQDFKIGFGALSAIGALKDVELGYYDLPIKKFHKKVFSEDYEVLSAQGNISWLTNGTPFVHIHAALSGPDYHVIGGHLFSGKVAVTLEVFVTAFPVQVQKIPNLEIGINVWDLKNCALSS